MTFSGLVKQADPGFEAKSNYPARILGAVLVALIGGWAFSVYAPAFSDLAAQIGLGRGCCVILALLTTNVSTSWGERMFGGIVIGSAFTVGFWGIWVQETFGNIPTLDGLQQALVGRQYDVTLFGETLSISRNGFEIWLAVTICFLAVPVLASLAKPRDGVGGRSNPFDVHPDFAQPFGGKLIGLSLMSAIIGGGVIFAGPYIAPYNIPIEAAVIPPVVAAMFYAKLHMTFPKALVVSLVGGLCGAAAFWLVWHFQTFGQDATFALADSTPAAVWAQVQTWAEDASAVSTVLPGFAYTPWLLEIWVGLTLLYGVLPLLITVLRRTAAIIRIT